MCLWQRLGVDIQRLLSRYGEFRDLRVWFLQSTAASALTLTSRNGTVHKPSELLTGDRRRLVVIVSDCVAPAWHNGKMQALIAAWSAKLPTVVFQVFPERLWSRTALARSVTVEFQGKQPGLPSDNLKPFARSYWDRQRLAAGLNSSNVRLPIVTVEQEAISSWAKVVAGDRHARVLGIVWDAPPVTFSASKLSSQSPSSLKERIDSFLLTSSPTARQLAGLLASAPVITLPIMRLVKQSLLPNAGAVHMAEVLMSGLLKVSGSQVPGFENAERIAYQLVDEEVRDRLRAGTLVIDALTVLEEVSKYVAQGLGRSVSEFKALLRTPTRGKPLSPETAFLDAFATVTAKILRGLGGKFEAIANQLQPSEFTASDYPFPNLSILEFTTAQLVDPLIFPTLQTQEVEVVTIVFENEPEDLQLFEFEVATLERNTEQQRSGFLQNLFRRDEQRSEWIIRKQRRQTYQWVETLGSNLQQRAQTVQSIVERFSGNLQLEMVVIPSGSFLMGFSENEPGRDSSESPQHEVNVATFFMSKYPITQAQWRFVAGLPQINQELKADPSRFRGDKRPVEQVSWHDAVEFCARLSVYTSRLYRLPTEAEWEYACRAGTTTPFHFGETVTTDLANYNGKYIYNGGPRGRYREETTPIDYFGIANAFGLFDMHGNVLEWCEDQWHDNYKGAPTDGSAWLGEDESANRIVRGGSWILAPWTCRSACRFYAPPVSTYIDIGFRVVCSAPRT
ncbi:formylglycine-generating enzyme family protein [Leptolyngbya sp. FACHB-671]|nr:formylglycine-generating enzyme family protein [Leptolyngbya sp. FACHB-671]